jgi:hypothetical protein
MPLEIGSWTLNENGAVSQIAITNVDAAGNVSGKLAGQPLNGFWNELSQKLTFFWTDTPGAITGLQKFYTGFLFKDSFRMPGIQGGTVFTLAGYVVGGQVSVDRQILGWYAQIGAE